MKKRYKNSLFIFRRDLRLEDNLGLNQALHESEVVTPCFILDPRQVDDQNHYRSMNALQFMVESLQDLNDQLKSKKGHLYLFYGKSEEVIECLLKTEQFDALYCNQDFTPFSRERDSKLEKCAQKHNIQFYSNPDDLLLNTPANIQSASGKFYSVFTAFYKHCAAHYPIALPTKLFTHSFYHGTIPEAQDLSFLKKIAPEKNKALAVHGGRSHALEILKNIKDYKQYSEERDIPYKNATTHLSAYVKFGCVSIREIAHAIIHDLGRNHPLLRQLYWRDFFTHISYHMPSIYGHAFHKKYDQLSWNNDKKLFHAWCEGKTGFPIVDAGMRELNTTGYMHNRVRMIVASFLVKDLHIDWRWGERYFAQKLIDYDPAVNNGNWQWCASTGCDAQPYFRIFNPWLQQKKFDPETLYIKKWIPELKHSDAKIIHTWYKNYALHKTTYPAPIVDHDKERIITLNYYKKV